MVNKPIRISKQTNELLDKCIEEFLSHNPKFREIKISKNKIVHEIALFYLKS